MTDNTLSLLGLARRGGNIALGEEPVADACKLKKAALVLIASDAGETTANRGRRMAEGGNAPWAVLPYTKAELGLAVGRASCALAAVTDRGLARAAAQKLAAAGNEPFQAIADRLADRTERRKQQTKTSRAGKKPADR